MKLVAHASPHVLEAELLDRIAATKSSDPLAPVLIVVPTRRLAEHVMHRLVERFGSILGVSVLHHRALAERVLEAAGSRSRHVLGNALLATLLARVMRQAAAGPLRDFIRDHPGAAPAMLKALTDLREAGIEPAAVRETLSGDEAETAALYSGWSRALDELEAHGEATDDAGLVRAAIPHAPAFASRFSAIVHHGAYDLIGVRVELVRALDRGCEITFLLPADPEGASGAFGVRRARAIAASRSPLTRLGRGFAPAPVTLLHAQGARAELQTAAYEALAAVAGGTPPREVAIIVRGWGPYKSAMDSLLDGGGPRWHTSYTRPLRRDPRVARALRAIAAAPDRGPLRWSVHGEDFAREAEADLPLGPLLQSMRDIETLLKDDRALSRREAVGWLEAQVDAATSPPDGAEGGGVRILDAMQARGLTFSHLGLAGMNAGIFPYVAPDHPFLADSSRARLREITGRPLPIAGERDEEERLLLAMMLGAARDRIGVSWRRADESARPVVPSLALRDIARFAQLGSQAGDAESAARALPAHPRARLEAWAASPGLLDRRDETLLAALASETGAEAGDAVVARRPELAAGVALVATTESFGPSTGRYDGRIGSSARRADMSVTALETLGRCPLQYFFRHVVRVESPRTPPTPFEADAAAIGSRVHDVLREVYARLRDEGGWQGDDVGARILRARAILRDAWNAPVGADEAARAARFPVLDRIERQAWMTTLDAFLDVDLRRLADAELVPDALEQDVRGPIPGGPEEFNVRARFDRVMRGTDGALVGDYKTGRNLKDRVHTGSMLSGAALQVPIYALLSGLPVELLGVGPHPDVDVARFESFESDEQRNGILETLRVIVALAGAGRFPLRPGSHCEWCDYRPACRRGHPPTEYREDHAADIQDVRDCWMKTAKLPSLAAVREATSP